jgi:hypothetical protein
MFREGEFLGFHFRHYRLGVRAKSIERFKERVRTLTQRQQGRNVEAVIEDLNRVIRGWSNYVGVAEATAKLEKLDCWIRKRVRAFRLLRRCRNDNWRLPTRRLERWGQLSLLRGGPRRPPTTQPTQQPVGVNPTGRLHRSSRQARQLSGGIPLVAGCLPDVADEGEPEGDESPPRDCDRVLERESDAVPPGGLPRPGHPGGKAVAPSPRGEPRQPPRNGPLYRGRGRPASRLPCGRAVFQASEGRRASGQRW